MGEHVINGKTHRISEYELKKKTYLCLMSVNILEAIRLRRCSFAFAERKLMEGNAKIIRLIARDEALHLTGTQHLLNIMRSGQDDPDFAKIARETEQECFEMFKRAATQEKLWAEYLFRDGSMIGLNKDILSQYVEYITNLRMPWAWRRPSPRSQPDPVDQHLAVLGHRAGRAAGSGTELAWSARSTPRYRPTT